MSASLKRKHKLVLRALAGREGWVPQSVLPDGNGHTSSGAASQDTIQTLIDYCYIERGSDHMRRHTYRLTDMGRAYVGVKASPT